MPPKNFSEAELELLTEEERQGLLDEELLDDPDDEGGDDEDNADGDADDGVAGDDDDAGDADQGNEGEGDEGAGEGGNADAGDGKGNGAADNARPAAAEGTSAPASEVATSLPNWTAPADTKDKITSLDEQLDDIAKKFDEGELTAAEMRAQMKPLEEQKQELRNTLFKADLSRDTSLNTWSKSTVPGFLAKNKEYVPGSLRYENLDRLVRQLQAEADNPFDPAILKQAHERIVAEFGGGTPTPKDPGKKRDLPPNLSAIPAADNNDDEDGGKFAYLDRLAEKDGVEYEKQLGKLSDAERDLYLQS
ncbi:hypothetical protein [Aminobacter sp. MDW-2]|uniref:hypothetical protein n=1 Tax=Aminobacter sp. MDW-2 TaxID=2666139 RepID=UPI0012AF8196|nr:hypothetical protein [Aminobacter sp. MDW-2]MRX32815.1 hypothetical protein [Aminobacter sp. MDW-2]QNH34526.1 hypothetical protein H5P29_00800 [Aminobacter sp. MDW-2]